MIQDAGGGVLALRNVPLVGIVMISVVLLEARRRKLTGILLLFVLISSLAFLVSSFYLPPRGHSNQLAITIGYLSVLYFLSTALVNGVSRSPGIGKSIVTLVIVGSLTFLAGFINTFHYGQRFHGNREADVAVVLGGSVRGPHKPSPDLRARLNAAARLYRKGEVKRIAVTGGTKRFHTYESKIGAWYLHNIGIPDSVIITENKTQNTIEQILYIKKYLIRKLKMKSVVVVSDNWHLPRALLMCEWSNVRAKGYGSHYAMPITAELFWRLRESAGLQAYMLFGA